MATAETGKSRVQRIELDYYRQATIFSHLRRWAVIVGIVLASCLALVAVTPWGRNAVSSGPLSVVHASFEQNCQQCHTAGITTPISSDAWRWWDERSLEHLERACQACHEVESHFRNCLVDDRIDRNCSGCHREHQGRWHDLTRVDNRSCTQCHAQLDRASTANIVPSVRKQIQQFTNASHGDFASLEQDRGEVAFDHFQHLQPGQVLPNSKGGMPLALLPKEWQDVYRKDGQSDESLVSLTCHDCHRPNAFVEGSIQGGADRELGRYFEPIQFDRHCAGCHTLNYVGRSQDELPLPHAAPWSELRAILTGKLATPSEAGEPRMRSDAARGEPMPGRGTQDPAPQTNIDERVQAALTNVQKRCLECHQPQHLADAFIERARSQRGDLLIPSRWLRHGLFDHAAHTRMACAYCHDTSQTADGPRGEDHQRVMIRGIDSCTPCHRPPSQATPSELASPEARRMLGWETNQLVDDAGTIREERGMYRRLGGQPTWASDQCSLCHRYHGTWLERSKTESGDGQ